MKHPEFQTLRKKLRSTAGESLVEVLAALLIAGMAILMLGQAVGASVRMIRQSDERMTEYYAANNVLSVRPSVVQDPSVSTGTASVSVTWAGTATAADLGAELEVQYYVNQSVNGSEVVSYGLTR